MNPEHLLQHFDRLSEAPDAIARLRRFILDLAVRGKLVEQDPNDEPAAELLRRIQAEKERLGLTPRRKDAKKSEKAEEEKLGDLVAWREMSFALPINWAWVPLGLTVNTHLGGGTPSKNNFAYWDGDIFWASVKDIGKGKYVDETIDRITEAGLANSSSNLIPPGNIIVVTRMGIGKVSINRVPVAINQDLRALSLSSLSAIDYYYNFLKTHSFEGSGLTVKGIKVEELLNIPFPLPPLAEQHRIVAKVDELMALCDQLQAAQTEREQSRDRLVAASLHQLQNSNGFTPRHQDIKKDEKAEQENLDPLAPWRESIFLQNLPRLTTRPAHIKQLRQTILNLAVRGKLVPQDPNDEPTAELLKRIQAEKERLGLTPSRKGAKKSRKTEQETLGDLVAWREMPFSIPQSWQWIRFVDYALDISTGPFGSALHQSDYVFDGVPLVNPSHMTNDRILPDKKVTVSEDMANQLATYRMRTGDIVMARRGDVGRAAIVSKVEDGWLCGTGSFFVRFQDEIFRKYILFLLRSDSVRKYLADEAVGTTMVNLNHGILKKLPLAIPPLSEQHRIVAKVDELMALCDQLETQLTFTETDSRLLLEAVLHEALAPAPKEAV